jgi:hypothetical protein
MSMSTQPAVTTAQHIIEIPAYGSVPLVSDRDRPGKMKWLLEEADWVPLHFNEDGDWAPASEQPPQPPTLFASKEEAEQKLRDTQHRDEVLALARNGPVNAYLKVGRVGEASALQTKDDFKAEIEAEKRAVRLDMLRDAEKRAVAARKAEEKEVAQLGRAEGSRLV